MKYVLAVLIALGCVASSQAGTVYVGYKDNAGSTVDYDYNDLVFSLTSTALQMNATGIWQFKPTLSGDSYNSANAGLQNTPFWNNSSLDGAQSGIGWCIYGGGACNGGVGLDPTASYFTTDPNSPFGSANDVTFTSTGDVDASIELKISAGNNVLGWYSVAAPNNIHWLNSAANPLIVNTFDPGGSFGLVAENLTLGTVFYSQTALGGTADAVSHFAFFSDTGSAPQLNSTLADTPEPASGWFGLVGVGLVGWRLRRSRTA